MDTRGLDHWGDITVVAAYFVFVLMVGLWSLWRPNRGSVQGYFLAGRSMQWFPVGASLFASNIGSEHFVGLAGTGAASGIAIVIYEWSSMPLVMALAWLFLPVYISAGVFTLPEYLGKRFGGQRLQIYLSALALVLYIVTKIAVSIYAGALFIQLALGWDMYISIAALLAVTGLYTVLGGLAAVIYTDTFQTVIMMIGAVSLFGISFSKIGGYENLVRLYMKSLPEDYDMNSTCGRPRADAFHLFRDPVNSDNPWPGLILQATIGCLWYWCCDQVIVQRTLAAKNLSHAKGGAIMAGYLKLLPLFLMILPGMISRAMYPDEVGCVEPSDCQEYCGNPVGCSNIAYPKLVLTLLPIGLRGLLMAVMLSAIMSSLTSIFNSASALFTMDLWRKMRPSAKERELLIVGRLFIAVLCGLSILWIPLVKSSQGGQLFIYIQAIQGYLGTPIGALFFWAILWDRMTEQGAFWGILAGHACGVIRMTLDFVYPEPGCGEPETRPLIVSRVHFSYFGSLLIVLTSLVIVSVSLLTEARNKDDIQGLTWWSRRKPSVRVQKKTANLDNIELDEMSNSRGPCVDRQRPPVAEDSSRCRRWLDFVCGIPPEQEAPVDDSIAWRESERFLKESRKWRCVLNINAVVALCVMVFLCGFFY